MARISSGVRFTVAGSSAGSPTGSEPSGSRRAARWPCMRCAFTIEVAAWTACSSASSGAPVSAGVTAERRGLGRGHGPGAVARRPRRAPRSSAPKTVS